MTWRGSSTPQDRFFACLTYLVPLLEVFPLGGILFQVFPPVQLLFLPLLPLLPIYFLSIGGFQLIALAIFFGIFIGVVQNRKLGHFLRFNAMQALLLAIFVFLCGAVLQLIGIPLNAVEPNPSSPVALFFGVLGSLIFLGVVGASGYSIVQCVRGKYAELPIISPAAYTHTR